MEESSPVCEEDDERRECLHGTEQTVVTRHILTKDTITANGSASRVIEESREHTGGEAAVEEGQASRPAVCATSVTVEYMLERMTAGSDLH